MIGEAARHRRGGITIAQAPQTLTTNVEFVKHLYGLFQEGDIETLTSQFAPDIEWTEPETLPEGGTHRGVQEVVKNVFNIMPEAYGEDLRLVNDTWLGSGEYVITQGRYLGTAPKTGTRYEVPFCHVMHVRNNKLAAVRTYTDTAATLKALNG